MLPQCALHLSDFDARQDKGNKQHDGASLCPVSLLVELINDTGPKKRK